MGLFFLALGIVFALLGLFAIIGGSASKEPGFTAAGVLALIVAAGIIFFDSFHTVGARGVAVQTAFGKVQGKTLGPGWHWVNPVNSIEEFDASVQTLKYYQGEKEDDGDCITVRLGNNNTACVDVTTQWNINPSGDVKNLYLRYKTFDNIHDNLVRRQLGSALNEVFGTYDPLQAVGNDSDKPAVNTKELQDKVRAVLKTDLGTAIEIDSVTIPIVHFDNDTESRLRAFQQSKADTRIAEQNKKTAHEQALANKELADQAAIKDPGVQYQNCLNLIKDLAQRNQLSNLPPTFNCGGSAGNVLLQAK